MFVCLQPTVRSPPNRATPAIKHSALFWQQVDKTFHSQPKMRNHNANKREGVGERERERERDPLAAAFQARAREGERETCLIDASRVNINSVVIKF